jgi:hypothetical protein
MTPVGCWQIFSFLICSAQLLTVSIEFIQKIQLVVRVIYDYLFNVNGVHTFGTCCKRWTIFCYFIIWIHCIFIKSNLTFCYLEPYKSSYLSFTTDVKHHLRKHFLLCCIQTMYTVRVIRWERFPKWLFFSVLLALISLVVPTDLVKLSACDINNIREHLKLNPPKRTSILQANGLFSASKD